MEEKTFKELLNYYLDLLDIKASFLAKECEIAESVISRYRTGEKIPKENSKQIEKLIDGIYKIARNKNIKLTKEDIINDFNQILKTNIDYEVLRNNLNALIECLNINAASISKYLGYDPSYLSKIRNGSRKPTYVSEFISSLSKYISNKYNDEISLTKLSSLLNKNIAKENMEENLNIWLLANNNPPKMDLKIDHFLKELNNFNLDDYIKVVHFDEIKVPSLPINFPKTKIYYGIEELKKGELDFFKSAVLDKNCENISMCSDMPMEDMLKDVEFSKKWMYGIAVALKKGIQIKIIHNINRPFNEMMAGLESWIPLYMTGSVSPYYLKNYDDHFYSHLNYISDNFILTGEAIVGHHNKARYYLTSNKQEVKYYQEKMKCLFNKATPLMEIYTKEDMPKLNEFYMKDESILGERKKVISQLPIHTINDDLLNDLIKNSNLSNKEINEVKEIIKIEKNHINNVLKNNVCNEEITHLDKDKFIDGYYINNIKLNYNYDNYLKHLKETKRFKHKNYNLIINNKLIFSNIDIYINTHNYVIISKRNNPTIHFVIKHEKLVNAIENFVPLIIEEN